MEFLRALLDPQLNFLKNALLVLIISSIPLSIIGTFLVANRMSYIGGAISHSVLGGIGISLYLSTVYNLTYITPTLGGLTFAILSGLLISFLYLKGKERIDTSVSIVWIIGMAIGLIFAYLTPKFSDISSYLFGNILLLSKHDLIITIILSLTVITISGLFFNQLLLTSFDREFAKTKNINVELFLTLLIFLTSITIFLIVKIVGIILSITLLVIPSTIGLMISKNIKEAIIKSIFIYSFLSSIGLWISYALDLPAGTTIALVMGISYTLVIFTKKILSN
jgi:zinc transport system permease protein